VEEDEFLFRLSFDHSEPAFEKFEDGVRGLVGDEINPGVTGGFISEGEDVFHIAKGYWVDGAADIRENTK